MRRRGVILIFALWTLTFLTVLAIAAASGIRQKIIVLKKFDERSRMVHLLDAGVGLTAAHLRQVLSASGFVYTPWVKTQIHNNPNIFAHISLGEDAVQVAYMDDDSNADMVRFGVVDEERKININYVDAVTLERLIERVLNCKSDEAEHLALAILDWREHGESSLKGFWSANYYTNLQYPYVKKDADYENMDELLLVEGMTKSIYDRLSNYLTIYGDGQVNINTASATVLGVLGLEDEVIEKISTVRRGKDGVEATPDDHVFLKSFDVASEVHAVIKLDLKERRAIDLLNLQGKLKTQSFYFSIKAEGSLAHSVFSKKMQSVIAVRENRIIAWKEK